MRTTTKGIIGIREGEWKLKDTDEMFKTMTEKSPKLLPDTKPKTKKGLRTSRRMNAKTNEQKPWRIISNYRKKKKTLKKWEGKKIPIEKQR